MTDSVGASKVDISMAATTLGRRQVRDEQRILPFLHTLILFAIVLRTYPEVPGLGNL